MTMYQRVCNIYSDEKIDRYPHRLTHKLGAKKTHF